jgi:hypothetical protein
LSNDIFEYITILTDYDRLTLALYASFAGSDYPVSNLRDRLISSRRAFMIR